MRMSALSPQRQLSEHAESGEEDREDRTEPGDDHTLSTVESGDDEREVEDAGEVERYRSPPGIVKASSSAC